MSLAVTTEHTMIAPPTETSMPPVMITNVMPMPINATGENSTSSGMIEPALRNAGVAKASAIHITTRTAIRAISAGVTGGGRTRLLERTGAALGAALGSIAVLMRDPASLLAGPSRVGRSFVIPGGGCKDVDLPGVGTELRDDGARAHDQEAIGDPQRL